MLRSAAALLSLIALVTVAGCGGKINRVNFNKLAEIINPKMNAKEALDWAEIEELLGGSGSKIDAKEFEKLTRKMERKPKLWPGAEFKIWRGKGSSWIVIQYDPKTNAPKGLDGEVPR